MTREVIRVEPLSTWLERWKAPVSVATRSHDTVYVSGLPPYDPQTGENPINVIYILHTRDLSGQLKKYRSEAVFGP